MEQTLHQVSTFCANAEGVGSVCREFESKGVEDGVVDEHVTHLTFMSEIGICVSSPIVNVCFLKP